MIRQQHESVYGKRVTGPDRPESFAKKTDISIMTQKFSSLIRYNDEKE